MSVCLASQILRAEHYFRAGSALRLLGQRHVHVEHPRVQHGAVPQRRPHRAVQTVLEVDDALPLAPRAGTGRRRTSSPPTAAGPAPAPSWWSPARRAGSAGAVSATTADSDSPWSGYGLPSRTPLKIIGAPPCTPPAWRNPATASRRGMRETMPLARYSEPADMSAN